MNRVFYSREFDPYYNLALEEDLLKTADDEMLLFIWINDKTVVIGRNQNPYFECDLNYAKAQNIKIARRNSGGGAVFHDLGNLNYSFITREKNADVKRQLSVILESVKALGVNADFSGRNDILIDGKKFSGQAYYTEDENYLHHGTIMIDVNHDVAAKVLTPSTEKLKSKGISSVKSRMVNLCSINPDIKAETMISTLTDRFSKAYGKTSEAVYFSRNRYVPTEIARYESESWIFGESPQFETCLEQSTLLGTIRVNVNVENQIITGIKIYSDFLNKRSFEKEERLLLGKKYNEQEIFNCICSRI